MLSRSWDLSSTCKNKQNIYPLSKNSSQFAHLLTLHKFSLVVRKEQSIQTHVWQYLPNLRIKMLCKRVKVEAYSPSKQSGLLGDDAQSRSDIMQSEGGDIQTINQDLPSCWFHKTEKRTDKGGFATASATHHTHSLTSLKCTCNSPQHQWSIGSIPYLFGKTVKPQQNQFLSLKEIAGCGEKRCLVNKKRATTNLQVFQFHFACARPLHRRALIHDDSRCLTWKIHVLLDPLHRDYNICQVALVLDTENLGDI